MATREYRSPTEPRVVVDFDGQDDGTGEVTFTMKRSGLVHTYFLTRSQLRRLHRNIERHIERLDDEG